jgi:choline-sulfatase
VEPAGPQVADPPARAAAEAPRSPPSDTVTEVVSRPPLGPLLRGDARRAAAAAVVSAAALAIVEPIATAIAAPRLPRPGVFFRLVLLDVALCALLAVVLAALFVALALAARLILAAGNRGRAGAWRGLFAPDRPPDPMVPWLYGLVVGAAVFVAGSTALGTWLAASFKEKTLAALVGALLHLGLVAAAAVVAYLVAAAVRRLGYRLRRLGRLSPLGGRAAALGLLTVGALVGLALLIRLVPQLRPLVPWRHLLALGALLAGAELAAGLLLPRGWLWPRTPRRRLVALGAVVFTAVVVLPVSLIKVGADPTTKALALSSSPPLATLIDAVRWANDFDRDGFGSLLGENDCAPFDPKINPLARDLPGNGIDENCDGKDFVLGPAPSYKTGERLPVPDAYREPWNILLLTIDTVRYDHTTMGGYRERRGRDTTPNLARLADRSVSFEFANAPSAGTMASIPAILTSRFFHSGIALGEERKGKPPKLKPQNVLISEILKEAGYKTGAILTHEYFNDWGMEQGFDTYDNTLGARPDPYRITSDKLTDRALAWIGEHADDRWFLWLHYIDPHGRYVAHPGGPSWGSTEEDLYDGELHFTDQHVGRLLRQLERLPGGERTVIIVTSDHGDAFGEHGFINHGQALYFELLHVPLIIYVPNLAPRLVPGPVSPIDILPTVADLIGAEVGDLGLEGESLVPQLFHGRDARDRVVFAETNYPKPIRAVITAGHKLVYKLKDNVYELYDLAADPREQRNLWPDGAPAEFARLKGFMDDWLERVYYARDPESNQAMTKLADVLLRSPPSPAVRLSGATLDGGAIEVLGIDLGQAQATPGGKLDVAVYFRAAQRPAADLLFQVEARPQPAAAGQPRGATSQLRATAGGVLPTSRWRQGEYVRDRFQVRIPDRWAGGAVVLALRVAGADRQPMTPAGGQTLDGEPTLLRLTELPLAPAKKPD